MMASVRAGRLVASRPQQLVLQGLGAEVLDASGVNSRFRNAHTSNQVCQIPQKEAKQDSALFLQARIFGKLSKTA